jgi:hypothetical protein
LKTTAAITVLLGGCEPRLSQPDLAGAERN